MDYPLLLAFAPGTLLQRERWTMMLNPEWVSTIHENGRRMWPSAPSND